MKSFFSKIFHLPVYIHLLAVIALSFVAVYVLLNYIDSYTNHNQAVLVPDIRGLLIDEAAPLLEQSILRYEVIDSLYSKEYKPGVIVDLSPEANSKVKKNRIIYITVNAKTEKTAPIPEVADLSYRQAYADLKSAGFKNVEEKYVSGEHYNLTIGVEYKGQLVQSGTLVPLSAVLTLVISDGNVEPEEITDANKENPENTGNKEDWF